MTKAQKYVILFAFRKHLGTGAHNEIAHVVDEMIRVIDDFNIREIDMLFKELTDAKEYIKSNKEMKEWGRLMPHLWKRLNSPLGI